MQKTTTFLMYTGPQSGKALEAINFYVSLFSNSEIKSVEYFKDGEPGGMVGHVKHALFTIAGQEYMAIDSSLAHQFTFTPAISIYVNCDSESELDDLFGKISDGGSVLMPAGNYGFSRKFAWISDKYGVSWQLNLK